MAGEGMVWCNGALLLESAALSPASGQGLLWGRGIFETIGVHEGQPFALTRHLERLQESAKRLRLTLPPEEEWSRAVDAVLAANPASAVWPLARLRLTVTGGAQPGLSLKGGGEQVLIQLSLCESVTGPAVLLTVPWRRNEFSPLAGLKCTSYAENAIALAWVRERDGTEGCFLNTGGDLCEGTVSNLFLVRDRTVITPSAGSGCLPGITRQLVVELCEQLEIPCAVRAVTPDEAVGADAVFVTSSLRGIQPVASFDNRPYDVDDPVTAMVSAALQRLRQTLPDP